MVFAINARANNKQQLIPEKDHLLAKISESFDSQKIIDNKGNALSKKEIKELSSESHLRLFLEAITK